MHDEEETAEKQKDKFYTECHKHFTEVGRIAEITSDFVLRARARMKEQEKVIGAEDSVVAELIKEVPQEKLFEITGCFQGRFMGQEGAPQPLANSKICFFSGEARHRTKKGNQKFQEDCAHVGDVAVVRDLHYFTSGKGNGPQGWKQLHVGEVDVTVGQHFHVIVASYCRRIGSGRTTCGKTADKAAKSDPRCWSLAWTSRRPSMCQGWIDAETKLFMLNILFFGTCAADFAEWVPNQMALPSCDHTGGR